MKKRLLLALLLPFLLMPFNACEQTPSGDIPVPGASSMEHNDRTSVKIYYFESAALCDKDNPVTILTTYLGEKVPKTDIIPTSSDPAFNVFKGWSDQPLVMSEDDYFDFENFRLPKYMRKREYFLYGQWDYEEGNK